MCDQCVAGARELCQPVKGWKLVRALHHGLWGIRGDDLGLVNLAIDQDIDIIIPVEHTPRQPAITWADYLNREDSEEEFEDLLERVAEFAAAVHARSRLDALADLVASSRANGWDPEHDGDFSWWLYSVLAHALDNIR